MQDLDPVADAGLEQMERQVRAGAWLRAARIEAGYRSAGALAKEVGVHQTQINNYERGTTRVPEERAQDLARALRLPVIEVRRRLGMWLPDDSPSPRPMTPEEAIRADETLDAEQREILLSVVATIRRRPVGPGITEPDDDGPSARPAAPSTL